MQNDTIVNLSLRNRPSASWVGDLLTTALPSSTGVCGSVPMRWVSSSLPAVILTSYVGARESGAGVTPGWTVGEQHQVRDHRSVTIWTRVSPGRGPHIEAFRRKVCRERAKPALLL